MLAKFILIYTLLTYLSCLPTSKQTSEPNIDSAVLREDLTVLHTSLREAHPGLYWYTDSLTMDSLFDQLQMSVNRDMTTLEFFKLLQPLIAEIRCSHTGIRLPEDVQQQMALQYKHFLPFEFYFPADSNRSQSNTLPEPLRKAYIRRSLNGPDLAGKEVLSINGISMEEILEKLLRTIPSDGYNMGFKYHTLSRGVITEGYALHYGESRVYKVETKDSTGQMKTFDVPGATFDQVRASIPPPLPVFSLEYRDSIAVLAINSFLIVEEAFADSITNIFTSLKDRRVKKLIIDIRRNGGGNNENVSALFACIALSPFRHLRQAEFLGRQLTYAEHIENADAIDHYSRAIPHEGRYIVNNSYVGTMLTQPRQDIGFIGQVELLISANTTSAASEFAAIFKYNKRGQVLGEETGGCYYGSTGGTYLRLQLPGSRILVTIPAVRIFNAVEEDFSRQPVGRGTLGD